LKNKIPSWEQVHTIIYDFDGVFTDNSVYIDQEGSESVRCSRSDSLGIKILNSFLKIKEININQFILSTEKNEVVKKRADKLKIKCFNGIDNKIDFIKKYLKTNYENENSKEKGIIYLGNDLNDLAAMKYCGYSIAPSDAHYKIKKSCDLVLENKGGEGFIRQFIEEFISIEQFSSDELIKLAN
tara:strand:+ start:2305 stop:2856 length:552 start_codon:yes stop_codon:yes gene_type:complete